MSVPCELVFNPNWWHGHYGIRFYEPFYFDRDAQQKALQALNSVLAENGTLFVGPAETGLLMRYGMQSAKIPLAFAFHRGAPEEAQLNSWHTAPLATAAALAMTRSQVFRHVVMRPALQRVWPAIASQVVIVMLGSSVVSQSSTLW